MEDLMNTLGGLLKPENVKISQAIVEQLKPESIQVEIESSQQYEEIEIELNGFDYCVYAENVTLSAFHVGKYINS